MSLPPEEPSPKPRSRRVALLWATACACCAGGVWWSGFVLSDSQIGISNAEMQRRLPTSVPKIVLCCVLGAVGGSLFVGLTYPPASSVPGLLGIGGAVTGAVGGALTVPTVIWCREWLSPLKSSTLLWCAVGFCAGLVAYRFSDSPAQHFNVGGGASDAPPVPPHAESHPAERWVVMRLLPLLFVLGLLLVVLSCVTSRYLD